MSVRSKILKEMKRERVIQNYSNKNRLIDAATYKELKSRKKCAYCKKPFSEQVPQIHHKIPLCKGGKNDKSNLQAVCNKCHKILDKEALEK